MYKKLIKRNLYKDLYKHLNSKEISLIVGPRQVGKTTLMLLLENELISKKESTLFLNLDREADKKYFVNQNELIRKIQLEIGNNRGFVFIDEIQRKENAGLFLKGIYDFNLPYKFIVSGSGSLELKEKIHESLVGRKKLFELRPISFIEFIDFKTDYKYENKLESFFEIESDEIFLLLREYLNFGGYPRVIVSDTIREKLEVMDEIFRSYLEKDISVLLHLHRIDAFSNLIKISSAQIGELFNYSKIAGELNISLPTLKNYLWYGEKTFILQKLTPYFKNIKKEIVKSPVYYFYDLGLRNYSIERFGKTDNFGLAFENMIFNVIKEKIRWSSKSIHFWRTKEKAEVDFIIDSTQDILPIEVKYRNLVKPTVNRSLRSFIHKYSPKRAIIVNLKLRDKIRIDNTDVLFCPLQDFLLSKEYYMLSTTRHLNSNEF